jgi:hypothetical protein
MSHECVQNETLAGIKKDLDNLYAVKDMVIELKTLITLHTEQIKKQDDILNQQTELLIKLSDSMEQHTTMIDKLSNRYDSLDNKFVERTITDLKENSISFNSIIRKALELALPPLLIAGLTYFVIQIAQK